MLFCAEGDKNRYAVRMSNSDPGLLRFFFVFLRRYFDVSDTRVSITSTSSPTTSTASAGIERFWVTRLGLPGSRLRECA